MKPVMNPMEMLSLLTLSVFSGSSIFIFVRLMFIYFFIFLMDGMWDCGIQLYNPFYIYNKEVSEKFVMNKFYFS